MELKFVASSKLGWKSSQLFVQGLWLFKNGIKKTFLQLFISSFWLLQYWYEKVDIQTMKQNQVQTWWCW